MSSWGKKRAVGMSAIGCCLPWCLRLRKKRCGSLTLPWGNSITWVWLDEKWHMTVFFGLRWGPVTNRESWIRELNYWLSGWGKDSVLAGKISQVNQFSPCEFGLIPQNPGWINRGQQRVIVDSGNDGQGSIPSARIKSFQGGTEGKCQSLNPSVLLKTYF